MKNQYLAITVDSLVPRVLRKTNYSTNYIKNLETSCSYVLYPLVLS